MRAQATAATLSHSQLRLQQARSHDGMRVMAFTALPFTALSFTALPFTPTRALPWRSPLLAGNQ